MSRHLTLFAATVAVAGTAVANALFRAIRRHQPVPNVQFSASRTGQWQQIFHAGLRAQRWQRLHRIWQSITVPIKDKCPTCDATHIDLSQPAFEQFADTSVGVIQVDWEVVPGQ